VPNIPLVDISAYASPQPPVTVWPMRIDLRQAPLATNQLAYLTIINNSTNPISLSEPSVDVGQVEATITQTQTGRFFTVMLKFPTGFQLAAGRPGKFRVKTTHPKMPLIEVPIYQFAHGARGPVGFKRPGPPNPRALTGAAQPQPPRLNGRPVPGFPPAPAGSTNGVRFVRPQPPAPMAVRPPIAVANAGPGAPAAPATVSDGKGTAAPAPAPASPAPPLPASGFP
jgi:hypothetical protein